MKNMKLNSIKILVAQTCVIVTALSFICISYVKISNPFIIKAEKFKTSTEIQLLHGDMDANNASKTPINLKYILQWTEPLFGKGPFFISDKGERGGFIDGNCPYTNCYLTVDKHFLGADYTKFDAIAFDSTVLNWYRYQKLPKRRSPHQKYVFTAAESQTFFPMCQRHVMYDGYFNWTWTYRLDSDSRRGYVVVRDSDGILIGPHTEMNWKQLKDMDPVSEELKTKLKSKTKAASWFVSRCGAKNNRDEFVAKLQTELAKYNLSVDVYGKCGPLKCSRMKHDDCLKKIERDYYFYLAFENSFDKDYVTEKLIHALQHDAVPIVYGGANYSSFMPDGIYLNARELGVAALARKMYELINNPDEYYDYFRWKSHYSFYHQNSSSPSPNIYCAICELLNDKEAMERTVIENFTDWWTTGSCLRGRPSWWWRTAQPPASKYAVRLTSSPHYSTASPRSGSGVGDSTRNFTTAQPPAPRRNTTRACKITDMLIW